MNLLRKILKVFSVTMLLAALFVPAFFTSNGFLAKPTLVYADEVITPTPTETPTTTPTPTVSPTPTPTEIPTPTANPTPTVAIQPSATPAPNPTTDLSSTPTPSATPTPSSTPTPSPTATPTSVTVGTTYDGPNGSKVKFNSITGTAGTLSISQSSLSSSQVTQLKALTSTVYDISSSMPNGSFTYDLTLPYPAGVSGTNFKVLYASDVNSLSNGTEVNQSITDNGNGTFTIHNLTHFTVFVVVSPNSQSNCDGVTVISGAPGTTPETTCFTTIQNAVNHASDGDEIQIGSTGSPYAETVYVNKKLTFTGVDTGAGNPSVTAFVLQTTPVSISNITTSVSIATPTVSLTNPVNNGNQTTTTISGTGAANATVNYTITGTSGSVSGTGTVSSGGVINITNINISSLPDGALTLTVNLTSGSYSSSNTTASAFKDTVAPSQASGLTITNPINNSNKTAVAISGSAETGSTVSWTISNGASSVSGTTTGGAFSVSSINVSALADGTLTLSVIVTDAAGNTSSAATTTATKDTVAPTVTSVAISSNNSNSSYAKTGNAVTLTFTSSETISTPTVTIAGHSVTATNTSGNIWTASNTMVSGDTEGVVAFTINFSDSAGNAGTVVSSTTNASSVTFDKTAPTLTSTSVTSNNANSSYAKVGNVITVTLTASENIQTPTVTIAGHAVVPTNTSGNTWTATYTMVIGDTEGLIAYTISYQDLASNSGTAVSTNSAITFDRTSPTLTSTSVTSNNANASYAKVGNVITVTFTASETIQTPTVTIAGHSVTATNTSGNIWTATYTMVSGDTEGLTPYTIAFQDQASNTGTAVSTNSTITFDRTNPTLTSTSVTSSNANSSYAKTGDTITVTFTSSESIQTPTVTIAGHSVTATNTSGNIWTATYVMTSGDTEGFIAYTINFQDLASNSGTAVSTNSTITFDRTNPTLTSTSVTSSNANSSYAKVGNTITVTFTSSETIQTPTVTIAGHAVTATNTSGNTWTASNTMVIGDTEGLIPYTIAFQDQASNAGTSIASNSTITFDRTTPTLTSTTITTSNSNSGYAKVGDTITVTFTSSESIQTPTVTIAGNTVTTTNTSGNTWTATYVVTSGDTEGLIAYTISYQDLASNSGTAVSTNSTITFDMTAPTSPNVSMTNPVNNSNKTSVSIIGTGEAGATVSYTIQDNAANTVTGTGTVSGSGIIIISNINVTSLNDGSLALFVYLTDAAGNTSSTGLYTATKDTVNPVITVTSVTTSNTNSSYAKVGNTITVNFSTSESVNTPSVTIVGHAVTVTSTGGNNWTASYTMTSSDTQGLIAYTINATDLNSNSATPIVANSTITFDRTNPAAPTVSLTNPINNSNKTSVSITGTGEANATFAWSITDGTTIVSGSGTVTSGGVISVAGINASTLNDGTITVSVTLTDAAGNTGSAGTNTATKDVVAPTLTSTSVTSNNANGSYAKVGNVITVTFTASETIQTPTVTIAGHSVTATNTSGNIWTATYTMVSGDIEGLVAYTIAFTDTVGNAGTTVNTNSSITFDRTVPTITSQALTTSNSNSGFAKVGDTVTLTFTSSESIQTPTVTIAGHAVVPTNTSGNTWTATYTMVSGDTEALITYTINYQDQASNAGTAVSTNSAITFDRTVPTITSQALTTSNSNSGFAKVGDTVTLTFTSSESIQTPTVTIAGHSVVPTNTSGNIWTATYTMVIGDTEGLIPYTIAFQDQASNAGTSIASNSTITFDRTTPTLTSTTITTSNSNSGYAKVGDTITVTFTSSESIQTPTVTIAGHSVTATNTSGNIWTGIYVMASGDTEGFVSYSIAFSDSAGNAGTTINTNSAIVFDRTAPTVPGTPSTTTPTNNTTPTWTWTASTDASSGINHYEVSLDGSATYTNIGLSLSYTSAALTQGTHTLTVRTTDNAGNVSAISTAGSVLVDTTAPVIVSMPNARVGTTLSTTAAVSDPSPSSGGLTYLWSKNSGTGNVVFSNSTSLFTQITPDTDGTYVISFTATDAAGNNSSQSFSLIWDTTPPVVSAVTLTNSTGNNNFVKNGDTVTLSAIITDNNQSFITTLLINANLSALGGGASVNPTTYNSITGFATWAGLVVAGTGNGTITINLTAYDGAGNNGSGSVSPTADNIVPTTPGTPATTTPINSTTQVWNWTASTDASAGINHYEVSVDGGVYTNIGNVLTYTTSLTQGSHTLVVRTVDNAGNISATSLTGNVLVDTTAPTGTWTTPSANTNVSGNVTLTATASDAASEVSSVSFLYKRNDGVDTFHSIVIDSSAPFTTTWDTNSLALDNYTLRLIVTDNAGNITNIDQTVGVATVILPNTVKTPSIANDGIVITWTTDDLTSSRVIYDTVSHASLGSAPNYGYSNSTGTSDTSPKVINHSVSLGGLNASKTYYYRVVSAGSPEAVSTEFNFVTSQNSSSSNNSGSSSSSNSNSMCTDAKPGSAPTLLSAKVIGNKVILTWSKVLNSVTYYLVEYGTASDKYQFGNPNVGNVTTYTVQDLTPGVTYFFRVRAGDNCMPGDFSNELFAQAGIPFISEAIDQISSAFVAPVYAAEPDPMDQVTHETSSPAAEIKQSAITSAPTATSYITPTPTLQKKFSLGAMIRNGLIGAGAIFIIAATATSYYVNNIMGRKRMKIILRGPTKKRESL